MCWGLWGRQYFFQKGCRYGWKLSVHSSETNHAQSEDDYGNSSRGFLDGMFDEVSILYTQMVNAIKEEPVLETLLPLKHPFRSGSLFL